MIISYDKNVDALYFQFNDNSTDGVVEIRDEINLDISTDGKIIGIEILKCISKN